ncbi:family 43 glycosylhydrolase [Cohnella suwonensis]|uniref:Family 43 glycosylhydrolase n=1 Tax=Cohnella suwonensis TaxID=696072 RepID=A0ABW0LYW8_9BACL
MFASFKAEGHPRVTGVLVADRPEGPFVPWCKALTPIGWECLDGTLFIDKDLQPWIIFCREWLEVVDGEMYALRLRNDFKEIIGNRFGSFVHPKLHGRLVLAKWATSMLPMAPSCIRCQTESLLCYGQRWENMAILWDWPARLQVPLKALGFKTRSLCLPEMVAIACCFERSRES